MKDLNLPEPVAAYFEADARDSHAVARCFTQDAVVVDEGQSHVGVAAIEAWKSAASARFSYAVEPVSLETKGRTCVVSGRVTGDFPGSPVVLHYTFSLERGKIRSLEIKP